jgi:hypothetical protein
MTLRTLAVAGIAMIALAGCTGGGDDPADVAASPSSSSNQAAALELAKCQRANGQPDFPDPVKDEQGRWYFPPETAGDWNPAEACRSLVQAWKGAFADEKALTPEDLAKLRQYSACMREHGLADFPDPDDEGQIELPDRLRVLADNEDPTFAAAARACVGLLPPKMGTKGGDGS